VSASNSSAALAEADAMLSAVPAASGKSSISITRTTSNGSEDLLFATEANGDIDSRKRKYSASSAPDHHNNDNSSSTTTTSTTTTTTTAKSTTTSKLSLRDEVAKELSQSGSNIAPPDHQELIALLQELERSASSDAVVRSKIAELPARVSDLNELKSLRDKAEAMELARLVNEALQLLEGYNARLQAELAQRKQTALLLGAYVRQQVSEIEQDARTVDEWQRKCKQVQHVKSELEVHLDSLPDLAKIDQVASLTPLPSAGDLFSSNSTSSSAFI
jgi:regulator of Ty1 transposition protein 103